MTDRQEVIGRVVEVMLDTFEADDIPYRDSLTAADVDGWDSLSNIRFMVAIEQEFGRKLTIPEWQSLKCVGDLVDLLTAAG